MNRDRFAPLDTRKCCPRARDTSTYEKVLQRVKALRSSRRRAKKTRRTLWPLTSRCCRPSDSSYALHNFFLFDPNRDVECAPAPTGEGGRRRSRPTATAREVAGSGINLLGEILSFSDPLSRHVRSISQSLFGTLSPDQTHSLQDPLSWLIGDF